MVTVLSLQLKNNLKNIKGGSTFLALVWLNLIVNEFDVAWFR